MKCWQRVAQDAGLPVLNVYETVKRDGREGVVYEREEDESMDAMSRDGELERRIEEGETQLTKVRSQRAATLVVLIGGSVSLICLGSRWFLDKGLFGVAPAVAALLLFVSLNAWRISRDNKRERELEAALEEYRDKKAQLERSLKDEE